MRTVADDLMLGRIVYPGMFFQRDTDTGRYDDLTYGRGYEGPSLNYRKVEKLESVPLFRAFIENPLFERVARARIEGDIVIYRALIMNKARQGGTPLPWHQDGGVFWGLDRDPELQIWTAIDDAPAEAGCVEVLDGSHLEGLATPLGGVVPAEIVSARGADARALALPSRAGEALLIHNHLWHRSGANSTGRDRRAMTICYMPAATRCLRKKRAPRSFVRVFQSPFQNPEPQ
jgi:phytanoyl-CoA hydroxylase